MSQTRKHNAAGCAAYSAALQPCYASGNMPTLGLRASPVKTLTHHHITTQVRPMDGMGMRHK